MPVSSQREQGCPELIANLHEPLFLHHAPRWMKSTIVHSGTFLERFDIPHAVLFGLCTPVLHDYPSTVRQGCGEKRVALRRHRRWKGGVESVSSSAFISLEECGVKESQQ